MYSFVIKSIKHIVAYILEARQRQDYIKNGYNICNYVIGSRGNLKGNLLLLS